MRRLLFATVIAALLSLTSLTCAEETHSLMNVDYRTLVSRADLEYDEPAGRSEEGMPLGNGRMGSLVWTTPTALKFQVNRVDVFAANCETNSFPERDSDYGSGCGYVDIDFVDFGDDVFEGQGFGQRLSLYDGLMTVRGNGVAARLLAWPGRDVMAQKPEKVPKNPPRISWTP